MIFFESVLWQIADSPEKIILVDSISIGCNDRGSAEIKESGSNGFFPDGNRIRFGERGFVDDNKMVTAGPSCFFIFKGPEFNTSTCGGMKNAQIARRASNGGF